MIIFGAVFNGVKPSSYYDGLTPFQYYIPTIAAVSVLGACYSQLAIGLAIRRQTGILKRTRATPMPAWTYFAGLVAHCVAISVVEVALIITIGRAYGVAFPHQWAALLVTLILGAASFCTLGVAVASLISNADAAPAVVQFILFPHDLPVRHLLPHPFGPCSTASPASSHCGPSTRPSRRRSARTPASTPAISWCCWPGESPGPSSPSAGSGGSPDPNSPPRRGRLVVPKMAGPAAGQSVPKPDEPGDGRRRHDP